MHPENEHGGKCTTLSLVGATACHKDLLWMMQVLPAAKISSESRCILPSQWPCLLHSVRFPSDHCSDTHSLSLHSFPHICSASPLDDHVASVFSRARCAACSSEFASRQLIKHHKVCGCEARPCLKIFSSDDLIEPSETLGNLCIAYSVHTWPIQE